MTSLRNAKWYDTWWWAISERMDPLAPGSLGTRLLGEINRGWLDMYYEPQQTRVEELFVTSLTQPVLQREVLRL